MSGNIITRRKNIKAIVIHEYGKADVLKVEIVLPFSGIVKAHELSEAGKTRGKIVLTVGN